MRNPKKSLLHRGVHGVGAVVAALWMLAEEWVWDQLTALMKWIGRWPLVRWVEACIRRLPPRLALLAFVIPWLVLLPTKVLTLWLFTTGHMWFAILVFVAAKVVGTALLARLFALTKPALLQIGWFRRFYEWFTSWKHRLYAYLRGLRTYKAAKAWLRHMRTTMRRWWRSMRAQPERDR